MLRVNKDWLSIITTCIGQQSIRKRQKSKHKYDIEVY